MKLKKLNICLVCTLVLLFLMGWAKMAGAQSLAFSQVLKISTAEDTVPAGKVWKVEAYWQGQIVVTSSTQSGTCGCPSCHHPFYVDGEYFFKFDGISTGGGSLMGQGNTFPLWLPAGSRLRTDCSDDFLSVIEFTVTP